MEAIEDKLGAMGLALPEAAAPLAAYVPFVLAGDLLHVSGQISRDGGGVIRGTLGQDMDGRGRGQRRADLRPRASRSGEGGLRGRLGPAPPGREAHRLRGLRAPASSTSPRS
jgi:hypothetical protein